MDARRHTPQTLLVVAAASVFLSACGGLDTPDLTVGDVEGQIEGAVAPSSDVADWNVHVVGKPEIFAKVDGNGNFTLRDVPVGVVRLVVFDGRRKDDDGRAQFVELEVKGAERSEIRRGREDMPRAGRIRAGARCVDTQSVGTEIEVRTGDDRDEATRIRRSKKDEDEVVELYPVPAGTWRLTASYRSNNGTDYAPLQEPVVDVSEGEDEPEYELELEVDDD